MTHDIRKLITDIRAWEAADKAYREACDEAAVFNASSDLIEMRDSKHTVLVVSVPYFVSTSTPDEVPSSQLLAAFVALADAYEAQAARIERALAIEARDSDSHYYEYSEGQSWDAGGNRMRDEFRAALTGNDEGDA